MRRPALLLPFLALALGAQEAGPWPGRAYRPEVPRPQLGRAYTTDAALGAWLAALAAASPRVRAFPYHVTEEGRPQVLLAISSPANLARLEDLKAANARLADPRRIAPGQAEDLVRTNPVFVWLAYTVHGSEPAGTEAALAVAYHFAACADPEVAEQLERTVLLLDVCQNPDGRARHLQAVAEALQGPNPPDPQDAQNQGRWPGGRTNHRLFDLNRDWAWQTQGESRARAALFLAWNPQVLADHHEMKPENNYFFPPGMDPVHRALPAPFAGPWQRTFGEALARAFDGAGFSFFRHEVFDLFYPSYGDSWASFQGAAGMTYECPNPGGLAYLRADRTLLTLEGRIRRHVLASLATVATCAARREELLRDWHRVRRERVQAGDRAGAFLLADPAGTGRGLALAKVLQRNGIEVLRTTAALGAAGLEPVQPWSCGDAIPAGSFLVPLDQPRGGLATALLEREAAFGPKPSYDVTAWSLPLAFGVPAWRAAVRPRVATEPLREQAGTLLPGGAAAYALLPGAEGREAVASALAGEGLSGTILEAPFTSAGFAFPAGTLLFRPKPGADPKPLLDRLAAAHPGALRALASGASEAGPDLGTPRSRPFRLPKVALLMDAPSEPTAVGGVLQALREAELPVVQLRASRLGGADLRRYTHLVIPDDGRLGAGWAAALGPGGAARLKAFCQEGGVLVALKGGSAYACRAGLADAGVAFLARKDEEALQKERDPKREAAPVPAEDRLRPWGAREDQALQETIPGAMLRVEVDLTHPLAWGLPAAEAAVLDVSDPVLDLTPTGENPLRFPSGNLKVAGLLPRRAEARLRGSAWALREPKGRGALVLFAGDPVHRGIAPLTTRVFLNALLFGGYQAPDEEGD